MNSNKNNGSGKQQSQQNQNRTKRGDQKPTVHTQNQQKSQIRRNHQQNPQENNVRIQQSSIKSDLRSFLKVLLTIQTEEVGKYIMNYRMQWDSCWLQADYLADEELVSLVTSLARLPFSSSITHPPFAECCNALKVLVCNNKDEVTKRVEIVINVVQRMLVFEWDVDVEDVRAGINEILDKATQVLVPSIADQRRLIKKVNELFEELEKPWSIKSNKSSSKLTVSDDNKVEDKIEVSSWKSPTVSWLSDSKKFCPVMLPKMNVPGKDSDGVYNSIESYFDIVQRLWTAITFCDGSNMLNPCCRWKDGQTECGHVLWPLDTYSKIQCATSNCREHAVIGCCNRNHPYGVCANCTMKIKKGLKGPPGPQACTNIYDCVVSYSDWDGRILFSDFESRKPPQKAIHWNTTRRLACSNLVGIIKVSHHGATISDKDSIIWGEIVAYDRSQKDIKEGSYREKKKLAVSLLQFNSQVEIDNQLPEFKVGDKVAILDCFTFVPEHIPVLIALDSFKKMNKPFNDLQMINIAPTPNMYSQQQLTEDEIEYMDALAYPPTNIPNQIYRLIQNSCLEPIIQIRRDEHAVSLLILKLQKLVNEVKLDLGQFRSFISALQYSVHCTQGPPGTGKSYLGVAVTRALLIIRKIWMSVCPSVGSPPILLLSYKNHAIDELAIDLIKSQPNVDLIRVGRSQDPQLLRYNERGHANQDSDVIHWFDKLRSIYKLRECCIKVVDSHSSLILAKSEFEDEKNSKERYNHVEMLGNAVTALQQLFNVIVPTKRSMIIDKDFPENISHDTIKDAMEFYSHKNNNLDFPSIESLFDGVRHYSQFKKKDGKEVLLKWMEGFKPLPKCGSEHNCNNLAKEGSSFCSHHTCKICVEHIYDMNTPYCERHMCKKDFCNKLSLKRPQSYCNEHTCIVCITISPKEPASMAVDESPRNTCEKHPFCGQIKESCMELAAKNSVYCEKHSSLVTQCKGINRQGNQCRSSPLCNESYCKAHIDKYKKEEASLQKSAVEWHIPSELFYDITKESKNIKESTNISEDADLNNNKSLLNETSEDVEVEAKVEISKENEEQSEKDDNKLNDEEDEENEELTNEFFDAESFVPNEVDIRNIDNPDEFEESEHLQHMREIYTVDDEPEMDFIHQEESIIDEDGTINLLTFPETLTLGLNPIPPSEWSWDMEFEERWKAIESFISLEKSILLWLNKKLSNEAEESRKQHYLAKIRANSKVYENSAVIAGTIVGCIARLEAIQSTRPFAIIVEEASEVSEPLLFACFGSTTSKIELIGDHQQLQPSMMSKFDYERINKMNMSLFERLVRAPTEYYVPFSVLSVQRRMRRNICDLTRNFYASITEIVDHPICATKTIKDELNLNNKRSPNQRYFKPVYTNDVISQCAGKGREIPGVLPHIYFWKHSGSESAASVGLSKVNIQEAEMVCSLASYLISCGVPKTSIAVLTPYKGQMMLLRKNLQNLKIFEWDNPNTCRLSTVDRFQGDEADVVIISMVIGSKSKTPFVKLVNRMIVLLSRARIGVYIVANVGYFENNSVAHWEATLNLLSKPAVNDTDKSMVECFTYSGPCIGHEIPICCPLHRSDSQITVTSYKNLKLGFCKIKCDFRLDCSHYCGLVCHFPTDKHNKVCNILVESPCLKHPRKLECSILTKNQPIHIYAALKLYACDIIVEVIKPCSHIEKIACSEENEIAAGKKSWSYCTQPAHQPYIYPQCKHQLICNCAEYAKYSENQSIVPKCSKTVDYHPSCGHSRNIKCYLKEQYISVPSLFKCPEKIVIRLPRCGHQALVSCPTGTQLQSWNGLSCDGDVYEGVNYGPKDYICTENVRFVRLCGHIEKAKCEDAFEYSKNSRKCMIEEPFRNPECGHNCVVKCYERDILKKLKRTQPEITVIDEKNPCHELLKADSVFVRCKQKILLRRKCGHEEYIECCKIQKRYPPCTLVTTVRSPLCGHPLQIECDKIKDLNDWQPWSDDFTKSDLWKLLTEQSVWKEHMTSPPNLQNQFSKTLPKCDGSIKCIRKGCNHQIIMNCNDIFELISNRRTLKPCNENVTTKLNCGHSIEHVCSTIVDQNNYKCKVSVKKNCWNYEVCSQQVNKECNFELTVHCDTKTQWNCENGHHFIDTFCKQGIPVSCPLCIKQSIQDKIHSKCETFPLISNVYSEIDSILTPMPQLEDYQNDMTEKYKRLLVFQTEIKLADWGTPNFKMQFIPGFIPTTTNNKVTPNKKSGYGLGIQTSLFTVENIKKLCTSKHIQVGYGLTCHTLMNPKLPKKDDCEKWLKKHMSMGYDSVTFSDSILYWEPYCFRASHIIEITDSAIDMLTKIVLLDKLKKLLPVESQFIKFQKPAASTATIKRNLKTLHYPSEFNGTAAEGIGVINNWDGLTLLLGKNVSMNEEKTLQSKLMFVPKNNQDTESTNIFGGSKHLENLIENGKQGDYVLFQALEYMHLGNLKDFQKCLKDYINEVKDRKQSAHPLLIWALAKRFQKENRSEKSCQCFDAFATLYPSAIPIWLNTKEKAGLFMNKQLEKEKSSTKPVITVEQQWEDLKRNEQCQSAAMEKLLKLTGLDKVKKFSISLFKTALALKKMKNADLNSIALNFAFMGNPGTGKTTVARLFAEILYDSKMRAKNIFIETTAQELKDNGADKFRQLANSAMDGVLFIDEAHDLDPNGDFKGKPIVSELLTLAENKRDKLSFIIAGYQDDIYKKLFSFNEGLKSRFEEVQFEDFNEKELGEIWDRYVEEKSVIADLKATSVVAKRLFKMANRKGFGNARSLRKMFESSLRTAMSRDDWDGSEIKIGDIIGECPSEDLPSIKSVLNEFDEKIGWKSVKKSVRELIELAKKNYQRELDGLAPLPIFVNRMFFGNPGTGKTTCAQLYGKLLKKLHILSDGEVMVKTASDFIGSVVGESAKKTSEILDRAQGKVLVIDEAYNLNDNMYGKQALDTIVEKVQGGDDRAVLLLGYEPQLLDMLRTQNPGLARRFPQEYAFKFEDYTDKELLEIFNSSCEKQEIQISSFKVVEKAIEVLARQRMLPNFGNAGSVNLLIQSAVAKAAARPNNGLQMEIIPDDIESGVNDLKDPFELLNTLFNIENIKDELKQLQTSLTVAKREGTSKPDIGHFVFRGSPGTGKTTVARVMAKILHQLDFLPTDRIIETSALQLTGDYVGQTKTKVAQKMGEAKGGVLFIDEAYELGNGMYGTEAMTTLLEGMTSLEYKGLVIVIAGYITEIDDMLNLNPGLKSRFTRYFDFNDWLPDNCYDFFTSMAGKDGFSVDILAKDELIIGFERLRKLPGWANGRDVGKLWKDTRVVRDNRVVNLKSLPDKMIIESDVRKSIDDMIKHRDNSKNPPRSIKKIIDEACAIQCDYQKQPKKQEKIKEEQKIIQQTDENEDEYNDEQIDCDKNNETRDVGVSDADWAELEKAKKEYKEKMDRIKREMDEEALQKALEEERKKAEAIREKIAKICACPMGYSWYQVEGGWRCGGGSHFVSDTQLKSQFTVYD